MPDPRRQTPRRLTPTDRMGLTIGAWRAFAQERLKQACGEEFLCDADWMLCEATGLKRPALRFMASDPLEEDQLVRLNGWLVRRESGEPLQYVLGNTDFMGLNFLCDPRALIPRPDTETLAERALRALEGMKRPRVLDLCCGTGAIGLSIAHFRMDAEVLLTDVSPDALDLARENAARLRADVSFACGDLWDAADGTFDLIVSNPPYLDSADMVDLQREVTFEPGLALFGGADGLDFYRRIAARAVDFLTGRGTLLLEVGQGQARAVADMLPGDVSVYRDLSGIERVVEMKQIKA